jgi:hypothetical protein
VTSSIPASSDVKRSWGAGHIDGLNQFFFLGETSMHRVEEVRLERKHDEPEYRQDIASVAEMESRHKSIAHI